MQAVQIVICDLGGALVLNSQLRDWVQRVGIRPLLLEYRS